MHKVTWSLVHNGHVCFDEAASCNMVCSLCTCQKGKSGLMHAMAVCRTSEELMLYLGAKIGYWRGDIKGLVDDIGESLFCIMYASCLCCCALARVA